MPLTEEQKKMRRTGIGGSDIAAIVGVHPYATPLDVYMEKMDLVEDVDSKPAYWGTRLEPVLLNHYEEKHEVTIERPGETYRHPEQAWRLASPDGIIHNGHKKLIEAKTASLRLADKWGFEDTDDVPEAYLVQVMWYLPVLLELGLIDQKDAVLLTLIGGQDDREYTIAYDEELIGQLVEAGEKFMCDHIVAQEPPEVDGSDTARGFLADLYPVETGPIIPGNDKFDVWADHLKAAREAEAQGKAAKLLAENKLKQMLGENVGVEGPGYRLTWKKTKDGSKTDWKKACAEADVSADIIARHTKTVAGTRRFLTKFSEEV